MNKIMSVVSKGFLLWLTGGLLYFYFEIMTRGYSHISMMICGGLCFLVVGAVGNGLLKLRLKLGHKILMIIFVGSFIITFFELVTGIYVNLYLGLNVWDYTSLKFNFMGQICLLYSGIWGIMSLPCVFIQGVIDKFVFE